MVTIHQASGASRGILVLSFLCNPYNIILFLIYEIFHLLVSKCFDIANSLSPHSTVHGFENTEYNGMEDTILFVVFKTNVKGTSTPRPCLHGVVTTMELTARE